MSEPRKILIADDDVVMRDALVEIVSRRVEGQGVIILTATTVEEVRTILINEQPDATLLDLGLGYGVPGLDLLREMTAAGQLPAKCRVAVFSAYDEYREDALASGAADFIQKPSSPRDIVDIVLRYLDGSSQAGEGTHAQG